MTADSYKTLRTILMAKKLYLSGINVTTEKDMEVSRNFSHVY